MKRFFLILVGIIAAAFAAYYFFASRLYPAASVNNDFISARQFEDNYQAANQYYQKVIMPASAEAPAGRPSSSTVAIATSTIVVQNDKVINELKRATLDRLIEDEIIQKELASSLGEKKLSAAVAEKIKTASSTATLGEAVKTFYGLNLDKFSELVLIPEARREVLIDELQKQNIDVEKWLLAKRTGANVTVFLPGLAWYNGRVEIKK